MHGILRYLYKNVRCLLILDLILKHLISKIIPKSFLKLKNNSPVLISEKKYLFEKYKLYTFDFFMEKDMLFESYIKHNENNKIL